MSQDTPTLPHRFHNVVEARSAAFMLRHPVRLYVDLSAASGLPPFLLVQHGGKTWEDYPDLHLVEEVPS